MKGCMIGRMFSSINLNLAKESPLKVPVTISISSMPLVDNAAIVESLLPQCFNV